MKGGCFMNWKFSKDKPIYLQIIDTVQMSIISGELSPGDKLLSVREMALEAEVNPNTMQKALQELEKMRLVFSQRTSGRFITEDKNMIDELKKNFAEKIIIDFFHKMKDIGFTKSEIFNYVEKMFKEMD